MKKETSDKLRAVVDQISTEELAGSGPKTEFVQFRVSPAEKESLQSTAKGLGLQVSEYLMKIHTLIVEKLGRVNRK